jgi:hypothetical protein
VTAKPVRKGQQRFHSLRKNTGHGSKRLKNILDLDLLRGGLGAVGGSSGSFALFASLDPKGEKRMVVVVVIASRLGLGRGRRRMEMGLRPLRHVGQILVGLE